MALSAQDMALVAQIQGGLPLVSHPYAEIGRRLGLTEDEVIGRIRTLLESGVIKRLGVVVRHHELGYHANAMVVWNIPDDQVDQVGRRLSEFDFVTLCYRRPRRLPDWPYNLFCMIHGQDRQAVQHKVATLVQALGPEVDYDVLFSCRRFKQSGACYAVERGDIEVPTRRAGAS